MSPFDDILNDSGVLLFYCRFADGDHRVVQVATVWWILVGSTLAVAAVVLMAI